MAFPTRKPSPQFFSQTPHKAQLTSPFESGSVQSRPKHTVGRMKFTTGWDALTETELQDLFTHFVTYVGTTWSWTHPTTSTVYTVRYTEDQLPEAQFVGKLEGQDAWMIGPIPLAQA